MAMHHNTKNDYSGLQKTSGMIKGDTNNSTQDLWELYMAVYVDAIWFVNENNKDYPSNLQGLF